jgi:hypothetical protein
LEQEAEKQNHLLEAEVFVTVLTEPHKVKPQGGQIGEIVEKMKGIKINSSEDSKITVSQLQRALLSGFPHKCASWTESTDLKHEINNFKSNIMCLDFDEGIKNPPTFELKASQYFHVVQKSASWGKLDQKDNQIKFKYHCYLILDEIITDPIHYDLVYKAYVEHYSKVFKLDLDKSMHSTKLIFSGQEKDMQLNDLAFAPVLDVEPEIDEIPDDVPRFGNKEINFDLFKECMQAMTEKGEFVDYKSWVKISFALVDMVKNQKLDYEQLKIIGEIIDDGQQKTFGLFKYILRRNDRSKKRKITTASIYYLFRQNGIEESKIKEAFGYSMFEDESFQGVTYKKVLDFPIEIFPNVVREFGEALAESVRAPIDYFATSVIGASSVLIGHQYQIWTKSDKSFLASVWVKAIGNSGTGKSDMQRQAQKPVLDIQKRFKEVYDQRLEIYKEAVRNKEEDVSAPVLNQIVCSNATIEALKDLLEERPILLYVDESAGWIKSMGQYKKGSSGELEEFLSIADNSIVMVNRKGLRQQIDNPYMTFVGGTQPSKLEQLINLNLITDDGFLERFLFSFPVEPKAQYNPIGADEKYSIAYVEFMNKLYTLNKTGITKNVGLEPSAKQLFDAYMHSTMEEINNPDFDVRLESYWRKTFKNLSRLILIMHSLYVASGEAKEVTVSINTVENAIKLMDYFKSHFAKMVRFALGSPIEKTFEELCAFIEKKGNKQGVIKIRDIAQSKKFGKSDAIRELLAHLEESRLGQFIGKNEFQLLKK